MRGNTPFRIEERVEREGEVRLTLIGELDLATRRAFQRRLCELISRHRNVRLDLSRLEFIDASGLDVLLRAVAYARRRRWRLQIEQQVPPQVSRLLLAVGLELPG